MPRAKVLKVLKCIAGEVGSFAMNCCHLFGRLAFLVHQKIRILSSFLHYWLSFSSVVWLFVASKDSDSILHYWCALSRRLLRFGLRIMAFCGFTGDPLNGDFERCWDGVLTGEPPIQRGNECWAVVSSSLGEAKYFIVHGASNNSVPSVQHLIDCRHCDCSGSGGGYIQYALHFMKFVGSATDDQYERLPATDFIRGQCRHCHGNPPVASHFAITDFEKVKVGVNEIAEALETNGPLGVLVICGGADWAGYRADSTSLGIFPSWKHVMPQNSGQHYMTLVGYGRANSKYYWKVRGSYGPDWGHQGYMRIPLTLTDHFQEVFAVLGAFRF